MVSVLYREPKLLKSDTTTDLLPPRTVSVLYREPKLLKYELRVIALLMLVCFSALP